MDIFRRTVLRKISSVQRNRSLLALCLRLCLALLFRTSRRVMSAEAKKLHNTLPPKKKTKTKAIAFL